MAHAVSWDETGLVRGRAVLNDDTFERGMSGWVQLYTPLGVAGANYLLGGTLSRTTRAIPRLHLRTPNVANAGIMGIKRMGRVLGDGRYLIEFLGNLENINLDLTRPRFYTWGLDYALANGSRRYAELRFLNYDEATTTRVAKFQLRTSGGAYVDVPGNWDILNNTNENKASPTFYIALVVNTATGFYEGLRIDDQIMLGCLNPNATQADLSSFTATYGQAFDDADLSTFKGGFNPFFTVQNRSAAAATSGVSEVIRQRTTYLEASGSGVPLFGEEDAPTQELNLLFSNHAITGSGTLVSPEIMMEPGAIYDFNLLFESATSVTAGTIAARLQVAPVAFHGYSWDSETSGDLRPWSDVASADGFLGHYMVDGNFPAPVFSFGDAVGKMVGRSIRGGALAQLARVVLTGSGITGGSGIKVAGAVARRLNV